MSGTFSSLSTALSALRYNQVAMDVASGNVANAGTTGYARRTAIGQATGAPSAPAIWSRWDGAGDGVQASRVDRMVDPLLDARSRAEHAAQSFLDARATSLARFETTLGEPGDGGIAAALAAFQQGWHDVANNPGDGAARSQLLARAETLRSTIATQAGSVATEWSGQYDRLTANVAEVNQVAGDLSKLDEALRIANLAGTDAGTLLDQRDQLTLRLAELTGGTAKVNDDTTVDFTVGGQTLVRGKATNGTPPLPPGVTTVQVSGATSVTGVGASPIVATVGGTPVDLSQGGGEMGAAQSLLNGDLPDYLSRLNGFVSTMADAVNTQHAQGADLTGQQGGAFFTYNAADPAASLAVAVTDPNKVAAADLTLVDMTDPAHPKGLYDSSNADRLGTMDIGAGQYRQLVTAFGVSVSSAQQVSQNQGMLTAQVDSSREALSGINVDEEMVNLLAAQRGYEGASRVLTTLDSVLDTLINRTGLTR